MDDKNFQELLVQLEAAQRTARLIQKPFIEHLISMAVLETIRTFQDNLTTTVIAPRSGRQVLAA